MSRGGTRLGALLLGVLALHSADAEPSKPADTTSPTIEQSGGVHLGDDVGRTQTKVVVNGNATVIIHGAAPAPNNTSKAIARPQVAHVRKLQTLKGIGLRAQIDECSMRRLYVNNPVFAFDFDFGKSITEFEQNHYEAILSERSLASTRPINYPSMAGTVNASDVAHERDCLELIREECFEYRVATPDGSWHAERLWASEWEDQEQQGLLKAPDRLAQIVRCFSDGRDSPQSHEWQFWATRLKHLAELLEPPSAAIEVGVARHHALYFSVLKRWAHLETVLAERESSDAARSTAGEIFARAATLEPQQYWLRRTAVQEFVAAKAYDRAAAEQEKWAADLANEVRSKAPRAPASEVLAAKMDAIELRGKAGQFDQALSLLHELSQDLDSNPWTDIRERQTYRALAHMLTGEVYALRKEWGIASEHYETAADLALNPDGTPVSADDRLKPTEWLLRAGTLDCFAADEKRMAVLHEHIIASIPYFRDPRFPPTWEDWRYLMSRWWAFGKLRKKAKTVLIAQSEADGVLDLLLSQPAKLSVPPGRLGITCRNGVGSLYAVNTLDGLCFGNSFAGGLFPAPFFLKRDDAFTSAATPLVYRSILEYVAYAERNVAEQHWSEAATDYAMASALAAELTTRLPQSGAFLQVAVLRGEASFLQAHDLNPERLKDISEQANRIEVENTCDNTVWAAYQKQPHEWVAAPLEKAKTPLGSVSLHCPLTWRSAPTP